MSAAQAMIETAHEKIKIAYRCVSKLKKNKELSRKKSINDMLREGPVVKTRKGGD